MSVTQFKPRDPREQDVQEKPFLMALRGTLPADTCNACGEPNAYHVDTTGIHFVGCLGVPARRRLSELTKRPLGVGSDSSDPWPHVSRAIGDVLRVGTGPQLEGSFELLSYQERLDVERRIAAVAVAAYLAGQK